MHSHFTNWPGISGELKRRRREHESRGESMLLFDMGDHIDRFHPFTEATKGRGNVELLNECGYDAVTIGNNEGITLSKEDLSSLYSSARFDCLICNLLDERGKIPAWAKPYRFFETLCGTKIGVIGVTVSYDRFYSQLGWKTVEPFEALAQWVPTVRELADIVIVLSHLGLSEDERMAAEFPGIDLILGGHTHHVLEKGKRVSGCLLCSTGKYGQHVGRVELIYSPEEKRLLEKKATLLPADRFPSAIDGTDFERDLQEKGKLLLNRPVAFLPKRLETDWFRETELNRMLCEGLTEWCSADASFINAGILLDDLPEGLITEYDIHRICPHPINPCTVRLTGSQLKEVVSQLKEDQYSSLELKGFGFRGKVFGTIIYDQIETKGTGEALKIRIGGKDLEPERLYTIATVDVFVIARFYPLLVRAEKQFFLPEFIRDVLRRVLESRYPLPAVSG